MSGGFLNEPDGTNLWARGWGGGADRAGQSRTEFAGLGSGSFPPDVQAAVDGFLTAWEGFLKEDGDKARGIGANAEVSVQAYIDSDFVARAQLERLAGRS